MYIVDKKGKALKLHGPNIDWLQFPVTGKFSYNSV